MKYSRLTGAALLVCAAMIGCRAAVTTSEPEPEPEPLPTLQGTWQWTDSYVDDRDGRTYAETQIVTFTGGGRAITANAVHDDTGAIESTWTWADGYDATATTVTRKWRDDHDDDDETPLVPRETAKRYFWVEGRDAVFIEPWGDEDPADELARYTRVADPLPDLVGRWSFTHMYGDAAGREVVVTFGADGAFRLTEEWGEHGNQTFVVTGQLGAIDPDTLLAPLTGIERSLLDEQGAVAHEPETWLMGEGRIGIAPSFGGRLLVSVPWDEARPEDHPYGTYWLHLAPVP